MAMALSMLLPESFQEIFPGLAGWIESLGSIPAAMALQSYVGHIEVIHLLGLFGLCVCVLLTSLRLLGLGLVEAQASTIYRSTRAWLFLGVIAAIGSGLVMGFATPDKLYKNTVFLWKMIAMIAGIVFSYAVMAQTAKADGRVGGAVKASLVVGLLIWALSFLIMLGHKGGNVAIIHVISACALIAVAALQGRMRWVLLAGVAILVVVLQILTHGVFKDPFSEVYMAVNKVWMGIAGLFVFGMAGLNIFGMDAAKASTVASRFVGYATILIWVTVAAGGRWIGLT